MQGRAEGRGRTGYVVGVVLLIVVGLFFAFACLGGVIGAAGSAAARAKAHESFAGDVVLAVVSFVIVVACAAGAVHLEHQLRRHHPVAQAWSSSFPTVYSRTPWAGRRGGRRYSPAVMAIQLVLFTGLAIGMVVGTFVVHSEAVRSSRVQHHGVARVATVLSVHNIWHSTRGGGYYTADVSASFLPPLAGRTTTTVHSPGRVNAPAGVRYSVLLDPSDPGYAEFPGSPATKSASWIVLLVFACVFAAFDFFWGRSVYRHWQHRRSM